VLDRHDQLALLPMHDGAAAALLEPLPREERFATWHLALPDGTLIGRGVGLIVLLRSIRVTRAAARLLDAVPDRALDALYDVVARNRNRLGPLVPNGPGPRQFP
jgi:predicted DCC family thiol-disulfide oxidoreductase YuxK